MIKITGIEGLEWTSDEIALLEYSSNYIDDLSVYAVFLVAETNEYKTYASIVNPHLSFTIYLEPKEDIKYVFKDDAMGIVLKYMNDDIKFNLANIDSCPEINANLASHLEDSLLRLSSGALKKTYSQYHQ